MSFTDTTPDFDPQARQRDGAMPRFYLDAKRNNFRSEQEGRPCFDEFEMVEILVPGDRKTSVVRIVNDEVRQRFPQEYARWKQNREAPAQGTPLAELPGITRGQIEELAPAHVKTIEALAGLTDDQIARCLPMGGRALRESALRWIERASGAITEEKLAAENRRLSDNMEAMRQQMAELQQTVERLTAQAAVHPPGAPAKPPEA